MVSERPQADTKAVESAPSDPTPIQPDSWIDEILDQLQGKDFYDALQEIEKLGASDDLTRAVVAVSKIAAGKTYKILSREKAKAAILRGIETMVLAAIGEDTKPNAEHDAVCECHNIENDLRAEQRAALAVLVKGGQDTP